MTDTQPPPNEQAIRRRTLLKGAIGSGAVAVAAWSAPKISVVPAYGLTVSNDTTDGTCYGIGFSSNNPTGKGWMKLDSQKKLVSSPVTGPNGGPGTDAGNGTAIYTWNIPALAPLNAFVLTIRATGCVNNGTASIRPTGMPAGYCLKLYNNGRAVTKDKSGTCGNVPVGDLLAVGTGQINTGGSNTVAEGHTAPISALNSNPSCGGPGEGKFWWTFDIAPCS